MQVKALLILTILPLFFISAYADPHTIETVLGAASNLDCVETECFTPNILTVTVGHTITMTNVDENAIHTYTSGTVDGFAATPDGIFDSGILRVGNSFDWTPDTAGEYPYYCMLHVWVQGTIIVEDEVIIEPEPPFNLVLDIQAMKGLDNNLMRLASDIQRAQGDIDEMMIYLEQAILNNERGKVQKYSERIGGLMAFVEICDKLVDTVYAQIELHS